MLKVTLQVTSINIGSKGAFLKCSGVSTSKEREREKEREKKRERERDPFFHDLASPMKSYKKKNTKRCLPAFGGGN